VKRECFQILTNDCLKKTTKFTNSIMIWGCMSGKLPGEMAILTSTVNAQVYIEILDTFLIPSIEKNCGNSIIFARGCILLVQCLIGVPILL
uniref:Uncharacterized protein n=1 Tax=Sinocyclocheilus anshuiensis TaxID=1608454 RepID=A0A671KXB7_9TELE